MKKLASALLALLIAFSAVPGMAHNYSEHNEMLRAVLFGDPTENSRGSGEKRKAMSALECASYIAIDQFNSYGKKRLEKLKEYDVPNLPSLDEMDYKAYGNKHRFFTHSGWGFYYDKNEWESKWEKRQNVLLETVKKVFNLDDQKKINSFAAILYYIHILGDYIPCNDDTHEIGGIMISFAHGHPSDTNRDVIYELEYYFEILFRDQKKTNVYREMKLELDDVAEKARKLESTTGGINTDEKRKEYADYAKETLKILENNVHILLKNEPFFANLFYK